MSLSLRRLARAAQRFLPEWRSGVFIICYHLVGAGTASPVDLPEGTFRSHLDALLDLADVVSLDEALDVLAGDRIDGRGLAVLTFDDAYANFHDVAWPILHERGLPVTLYVPVGFVAGEIGPPIGGTEGLLSMSWSGLTDLASEPGLSVGSHGWSHVDLRAASPERVETEIRDSRRELEDRLGTEVDSFCYAGALWSRRIERLVAGHYASAVVGGGRTITPENLDPMRLWRISIRRDMPGLEEILRGPVCLEEWLADKARRFFR